MFGVARTARTAAACGRACNRSWNSRSSASSAARRAGVNRLLRSMSSCNVRWPDWDYSIVDRVNLHRLPLVA